ncbi:MAG: acyltransferase family protein [Pseudohongiella sp.]|nr:acyltransferase family protein [Pseudohongiella sp.]MDO9520584.1 acyltransferase family protein [Pseudohongiella sp.]MDP2126727.1 acyltransferase family protein [Pseudohongiella sp.]
MINEDRLHALDAVRASALLLGIVLHSTMSFFLPIPAMDVSQSPLLAGLFYVIHIFRMSLFFLIAGFFAHMVFHRRGAQAFIRDRFKRIALPMLVGWVIISPMLGAIVIWGLIRTFGVEAGAGAEPPDMGLPLTHLWFLYYLCIFYAGTLTLRYLLVEVLDKSGTLKKIADKFVSTLVPSVCGPLIFGLPLAFVLHNAPVWHAWFGLPTPDYGLTPQLPAIAGYGFAFSLGWLMHRQTNLLNKVRARGLFNLAIAIALTIVCLTMAGVAPSMELPFSNSPDWHKPVYVLCYTMAIWFWVFAIIGSAMRLLSAPSARWRYLADASYWMYLAHLPIVFFLQVIVAQWPLHWVIKFPLILVVTTALLLLSYHTLVRPTRLGRWLNGKSVPRHRLVSQN